MIINLAIEFEKAGCPVHIVLAQAKGPYLKEVPPYIRVVSLEARRLRLALWRLIRYLRRERPIALMPTLTSASILAVLASRLSGVPLRMVIRQASHLGKRQRPWLVRLVYPRADQIIVQSRAMAADLERHGISPTLIRVIGNPTVRPEMRTSAVEPVEHPWFAEKTVPVVIGVGRLVNAKGFDILLDACARARRHRPLRLVILGEGEKRKELEARILELGLGDDVWMPGFIQNPFRYIARADLFVLPSRVEPFGNVIVEALALGTPVVATDCPGGAAEVLENGRWGTLVPVEDTDAMARAILSDLRHAPFESQDLIRYARRFDSETIARSYMQVLGVSPVDR